MGDFIKNTMSLVIIGDEDNSKFDGKIKMNGKEEGFHYHRDSIKQIVKELKQEGYPLDNINFSDANESGFDLVNKGHILFCNCTMGSYCFGYIFLPKRLTDKQIESLRLFESNFQKFPQLYLMRIDKQDQESFETEVSAYDFNVDLLIKTYYNTNTKTK
ncbi:MAG: hypothetical protein PHD10_04525 [Bacilli bacterium]|nr:hypothetical protein [Bacilli bacterium]